MNNLNEVEQLIAKSLKELRLKYTNQRNDDLGMPPSLIFPQDRKGTTIRVSEQEAIILFIKTLENSKYHYAVEVPTSQKYLINNDAPKIIAQSEKGGNAGNIDVCLYHGYNMKHMLEFKEDVQGSSIPRSKCKIGFAKDFLRLKYDSETEKENYFVHVVEHCSIDKIDSVKSAYYEAFEYLKQYDNTKTRFKESSFKIFLCFLSGPEDILVLDNNNFTSELAALKERIIGNHQ